MLSNLLLVAGQVGTLFLMMAVGFVLAKLKKLTPEAVPQISFLLLYVVVPCVVVNALQVDKDPALLRELGVCALVVAVSYVVYALLVLPFFRRRPEGTRASLQFGVVYGLAPNAFTDRKAPIFVIFDPATGAIVTQGPAE